eukprot:6936952-Prymnesium_polylepis.1
MIQHGGPHADQIDFVLGKVGRVRAEAAAQPHRRVARAAEDTRLEDVKRGQIDRRQDGEVERRLRRERPQPRPIARLVGPGLARERVDVEEPFEDLDLVQVLEASQVDGAEAAEEEAALPVHGVNRRLRDDDLGEQVRGGGFDRRDCD